MFFDPDLAFFNRTGFAIDLDCLKASGLKHFTENLSLADTPYTVGEPNLSIVHHLAKRNQLFDPGHLHVDLGTPRRGLRGHSL